MLAEARLCYAKLWSLEVVIKQSWQKRQLKNVKLCACQQKTLDLQVSEP